MENETEIIYNQIENKILNHEIYQSIKDYSKAKEKMKTYLEIGELISSIDTKYGKSIIKEYSKRLITKFGKQYSVSLLYKIKQFYLIIQKVPTLSGKLTWSHYDELLKLKDEYMISYYIKISEEQNSEKLMIEVGKKYNERNLRYMRQFYELFTSIKLNPLGSKLNWSHYRELLILSNKEEILYYIKICEENNLYKNHLQEK